jgi:hypothetical protein
MPKFYPKSQIKTGFYTDGGEYIVGTTKLPYVGKYYKLSNGKIFSGENYNDPNSKELILIEEDEKLDPISELYYNDAPPASDGDYNPTQTKSYISDISYLSSNTLKYTNLTSKTSSKKQLPKYTPASPTLQDYSKGEFLRYFCKKNNEPIYIEISQDYYEKLASKDSSVLFSLYTPLQVNWLLTGTLPQVYTINKKIVTLAEKENKCIGFTKYFQGKFSKYFLET